MPHRSKDDLIRIRVDAGRAVRAFLDLLERQAAEGETRQPAKPRATALYREIAPFRLVEYAYVDDGVGTVDGAYVGLPNGLVYSVSDDIPEADVDALVDGPVDGLPPVYVFVVLQHPVPGAAIDHFLSELSHHVGVPMVGVFRDAGGMVVRGYPGDDPTAIPAEELDAAVDRAQAEADLHLTKELVLDRYVARTESPDGRAYAKLGYDFARHLVVFPSAADRDDFIAWSRELCERVYDGQTGWEELGFDDVFHPAEPVPEPVPERVVTALEPPGRERWRAFREGAVDNAMAAAYWRYVKDTIDRGEVGASRLDGWVIRT